MLPGCFLVLPQWICSSGFGEIEIGHTQKLRYWTPDPADPSARTAQLLNGPRDNAAATGVAAPPNVTEEQEEEEDEEEDESAAPDGSWCGGGERPNVASISSSSFRAEKADIGLPRRGARRLDRGALGAIRGGRGSLLGCAGAEGRGGVVGGVTGRGRTGGCRGRMDGHGSEIITEPF